MAIEVYNAPITPGKRSEEAQDPVYLRIRDIVYQACGIYHSEEKLYLLASACERRLNQSSGQASTVREYVEVLTSPSKRDAELRALMNEITIGETSTRFWLRNLLSSLRVRRILCRARIPAYPNRVPDRGPPGRDRLSVGAAEPR